jgi:uncharacterized membrane protein YcaP (DUF421 family)
MLTILPDDLDDLVNVLFEAVVIVSVVILLTRLNGLRSFSKQSSFDLPITVATGSVIATTIAGQQTPLMVGVVAVAGLFAFQALIAVLRVRLDQFQSAIDNRPLLLMEGDRIIEANLRAARMSREDLIAKLRMADVRDPGEVRAVIFETTADVSVIKGPRDEPIHPMLMQGVRRTA